MKGRSPQKYAIAGAALLLCCSAACAAKATPARAALQASVSCLAPRPLDLRAPDIHGVSEQQIQAALATAQRNIEEVQVKGAHPRPPPETPAVWRGIFAPFWALAHPGQAWRIFAPLPPDRALTASPPNAKDPAREPPTGTPKMSGE
ncbi:MAG TPA: hypothetical protein VHK24_06050 [Steroidobacter sp.]|jgi:hypothetical protein|nr:hypothetical protein [Steroidobacter sp.]